MGWIISRYWNRIAYLVIGIGRKMIWDYTGKNENLLGCDDFSGDFASDYTKAIMCDSK